MGTAETTYLREDGLSVTSARIDIDGQTFAVRNVSSVKVDEPGAPRMAFVLLVFLLFASKAAGDGWIVPAAMAAACAVWIVQRMRACRLVLVTAGGEAVAMQSTNRALVRRLRDAIAQAMAERP